MVNGGIAGTHEVKFEIGGNSDKGRFPANVIHDGSDEVVKLFPDSEGGHFPSNNKNGNSIFGTNNLEQKEKFMNDSGSGFTFLLQQQKQVKKNVILDCMILKMMSLLMGELNLLIMRLIVGN